MSREPDPFPSSEFDEWAAEYDREVSSGAFPFTAYGRALAEVVRLAGPEPGMSVLDAGLYRITIR